MMSLILRKALIVGFRFNELGCCKPTTLSKKTPIVFRVFLGGEIKNNFFRIEIKNKSC